MSGDNLPGAWTQEADGSAVGYMCLTDWEYEIGNASGGNAIYPSIEDLLERRKCAEACGIIMVRVSAIEVIRPAREDA